MSTSGCGPPAKRIRQEIKTIDNFFKAKPTTSTTQTVTESLTQAAEHVYNPVTGYKLLQ